MKYTKKVEPLISYWVKVIQNQTACTLSRLDSWRAVIPGCDWHTNQLVCGASAVSLICRRRPFNANPKCFLTNSSGSERGRARRGRDRMEVKPSWLLDQEQWGVGDKCLSGIGITTGRRQNLFTEQLTVGVSERDMAGRWMKSARSETILTV